MHTSVIGVEMLGKDNRFTWVIFRETWVGHTRLALQTLPCNTANSGMHGLAHFFIHRCHTAMLARVIPIQPHAFGNLLNDPKVWFCFAWWIDRLFPELHHAIGVADGACFFWPSCCWQDHVGQPCRLGHEDILHHHVL